MAKKYEAVDRTYSLLFIHEWVSFPDFGFPGEQSPIFSPNGLDMWRLKLNKEEDCIWADLYLVESNTSALKVKCYYRISDNEEKLCEGNSGAFTLKPGEKKKVDKFQFTQGKDALWLNSGLHVYCRINVELNVDDGLKNIITFSVSDYELTKDLNSLFETLTLSDVTIKVNDREFRAHKAILAMRSRVFCAMFNNEMSEKQNNEVNVTAIDQEVFQEILRFVYTGKVNNIKEMADRLLAAADRYELMGLKVMCEEELRSNLAIENAADILILADLHCAKQLKARTVKFMSANLARVLKTQSFLSMTKSHPVLMAELLHATVKEERNDAV